MAKDIREDMVWALDTFIINLREHLESLELDNQSGASDQEFLDRILHITNWIVPGFQTDMKEMIEDLESPFPTLDKKRSS